MAKKKAKTKKAATKKSAVKKAKIKSPAGKRAKKAADAPGAASPGEKQPVTVQVRMYRQGIGDCFLLRFNSGGKVSSLLIDCGVLLGTPDAENAMRQVVQDVRDEVGGHLDVLAVTHEHWDHVSGFVQAQDVFRGANFQIDHLWLAWTEDPDDPQAQLLRAERERRRQALQMAVPRLRAMAGAAAQKAAADVEHLLGFFGGLGARRTTADAMQTVVRWPKSKPDYLKPGGDPLRIPQIDGVRVYVLGPPEEKRSLRKSRPSRRDPETYDLMLRFGAEASFYAALAVDALDDPNLDDGEKARIEDLVEQNIPFDEALRIPAADAEQQPFFTEHYFGKGDPAEDVDWRKIDEDWLRLAPELALKLDEHTNNTSLVLAIELVHSSKVLLFPGDAQVGNWESWHKLPAWQIPNAEGRTSSVTTKELLKRTVLYKVGHHGSHNATLREFGLEMMDSPELVAMIPVDERKARKLRWRMPFAPLYERLLEKTRGRTLRADEAILEERPEDVSETDWNAFTETVETDPLYVEYTLDG